MKRLLVLSLLLFSAAPLRAETKEEEATRYLGTMITAVREENDPMRNRMFIKLRVLGTVSTGPILAALEDPAPEVRHYLAFTLGFLDDPSVTDPLRSLFLSDPDVAVRCAAAEALGRLQRVEAFDDLVAALSDESARIRQSAAYSLGQIGDPRGRPYLEKAKSDDDELVRFFAEDALVQIDRAEAREKRESVIRLIRAAAPLLACALLLAAPPSDAAEKDPDEILARMRAGREELADLQARFVHWREVPLFDEKIRSEGDLYFQVPGRLDLQYTEPDSNRVLIGDGHVWLYYPTLGQAHRYDIDPESTLPGLFLALRGTLEGLRANFDVSGREGERVDGLLTDVLVLHPKEKTALAEEVKEIDVVLRRSDLLPVRTDFFELSGDHTWFTFSHLRRNRGIDPELFRFRPPEGTELFEVEGETW